MPGSILQVAVDNTQPVAAGMPTEARRVLRQQPGVPSQAGCGGEGHEGRSRGSTTRRRCASGWAWGQNYLEGGAAIVESSYGKGKVYMFGPEITFRGQPHGTFKFLFNGIYAPTNVTPTIVP